MWKCYKKKNKSKLNQIYTEGAISGALNGEGPRDSSKNKVIKVKISFEKGFSCPPFLEKM